MKDKKHRFLFNDTILFVVLLILIFCSMGVGLYIYSGDSFEVYDRKYNLNLNETIDLDTVYSSPNIKWKSNNDNVSIKNNVLKAVKSGTTSVVGKVNSREVVDLKINVLEDNENLYMDNHSIQMTVDEARKVEVVQNKNLQEVVLPEVELVSDNSSVGNDTFDEFKNIALSSNSDGDNLNYVSSDEKVATVDDDGNINPVDEGTVVISVEDGSGNEDHTYVTVIVDDFRLYSSEYCMLVGDQYQVNYYINTNKYDSNDLVWSSDNPDIVTVDDSGKIIAISEGVTYVNVSLGNNINKKVAVSVKNDVILPSDLSVSSDSVTIDVGDSNKVDSIISPTDVTLNKVFWVSDNPNVATVNDGLIIGKNVGNTTVYATTLNGITKKVNVVVNKKIIEATDIILNVDKSNLKVGESTNVSHNFVPSDTTNKTATYIYDRYYINLDKDGKVTALREGTTKILVRTINNCSAYVVLNIKPRNEIGNIKINTGNFELKVKNSKQLSISTDVSDWDLDDVRWESSNNKVATVDKSGKVVAVSKGTAVITVSSVVDDSVKASVKVNVISDVYTGVMTNPCPGAVITSLFGPRSSPCSGCSSNHMGIDLGANTGTPVVAADGGTVTNVSYSAARGNYIDITHKKGMITRYQHLSQVLVKTGQVVNKGTVIGKVGSTGYVTGPHLHFEVQINGSATNPCNYYKSCNMGSQLK